jgi:hypothetical protein
VEALSKVRESALLTDFAKLSRMHQEVEIVTQQ